MYENPSNTIFNSFSPTPFPMQQSAPYREYWTRYKEPCPNKKYSFYELNMKRKALTLQYKNTSAQLKNTSKYIKAVNNRNRITNRDNNGLISSSSCNIDISSYASQNNVPGDKSTVLYNNPKIAVYNYIPVKRTYQGGNNKYPYSSWQYGRLGFPRGMKGTSREMRRAAEIELSNNPVKYLRYYNKTCYNSLCINEIITEISAQLLNNNNIENTIKLTDNSINISIYTSNNSPKKTHSNKNLYPIFLNPEYTNIETEGQIWCSQFLEDINIYTKSNTPKNTYTITYNNILENDESSEKPDISYIYFLTSHNNEWWYSISKLTSQSINNIIKFYKTDRKTLAYAMFAPYPFIEFKLDLNINELRKSNKLFTFKTAEIYFQTNKVKTNINVNLNNVPIQSEDYRFTSNRCLQNSGTKIFFTITKEEWTKKFFHKPLYIKGNLSDVKSNSEDISGAQCGVESNMNSCMPCDNNPNNCGKLSECYGKASDPATAPIPCPKDEVFSALTNTFWWRTSENNPANIFNYPISNKFIDISNNLCINATFNYNDYCTTKQNLEFIINCRE